MRPQATGNWIRWGKFNLVGVLGTGLQLGLLALFNRWMAGRYLYASAAAVEITLLHNFVWHWRYTWLDRSKQTAAMGALVRFHLSNGMVSLLGTLVLMRFLVRDARLPLLLANLGTILCCSVANFYLGNYWAFAGAQKADGALDFKSAVSGSTHSP